jgi:hypothetical protein
MTNLELQAMAFAAEVQKFVTSGGHQNYQLMVLALNQFRRVQQSSNIQMGADLDAMYAQHVESLCPVINLAQRRLRPKRK